MNIYLVILLIIAIVIFSNLAMIGMVRGSRSMKFDWLNTSKDSLSQPFLKENDQLGELRQRVDDLSQADSKKPDDHSDQ
ncbi:MAG: hypothetical protein HN855_05585 [Anaerolineae bacterium]|jgi:hypothetical protein|nr:hypothetical protein [Anaerolineae bacterium]MBT7072563.1 hypothetical protein [Anaerolineae bacterium]MBT7324611.1 hypothetical protein [Anaerolineae bacterium]